MGTRRTWKIEESDGMPKHVVAIAARVDEGHLIIAEHWNDKAEIWGDGVMVRIPRRIWTEIIEWSKTEMLR